ncbi:MAG: hypothetical protein HY600_02105 [Candidatus Omnitrophica bacterium]|nr:hypothetical protein [Candidatus Omnitrophota bacterium]
MGAMTWRWWAGLAAAAAIGAYAAVGLDAPSGFTPWVSELDLSRRAVAESSVSGAEILVRNPKYPAVVDVMDRGGPVQVVVPLPRRGSYVAKMKLAFGAGGQAAEIHWNGERLTTVHGAHGGRAEKFLVQVPAGVTRPGDNVVTFLNSGTPKTVRHEQIKLTNYRAPIVERAGYLLFQDPSERRISAPVAAWLCRWGLLLGAWMAGTLAAARLLGWALAAPAAGGVAWVAGIALMMLHGLSWVTEYRIVLLSGWSLRLPLALWGGLVGTFAMVVLVIRGLLSFIRRCRTAFPKWYDSLVVGRQLSAPKGFRGARTAMADSRRIGWRRVREGAGIVWGVMRWLARRAALAIARAAWWIISRAIPIALLAFLRWVWRRQSASGYLTIFAWLLAASWLSRWLRWTAWATPFEDAAWVAILISVTLYAWRALRDGDEMSTEHDATR